MNLDWMDQALCAQTDPALWFPDGAGHDYRKAKAICGRCPVRDACEAQAQRVEGGASHPYRHGAWGGTTPRDRAARSRQNAREVRDAEILRLANARWGPAEIAKGIGCAERTVLRVLGKAA